MMSRASHDPILSVEELRLELRGDSPVTLVDGVSFTLFPRRILGIVGESGCGKSVTALSILRLAAPAIRATGRVMFEGEDILTADEARLRRLRGGEIAMIFQEPMTSLNPVFTVGDQIIEAIRAHRRMSAGAARDKAIEMLTRVGIPSPETRIDDYPHQMSGGMRQRVMIAMALACEPKVLIADEPTTALDVTIQAQILELLAELRDKLGLSVIIITHDLGVVAELADDVVVMYAGRVVERAGVRALFAGPLHPYAVGLMESRPPTDHRLLRLPTIGGGVPSPGSMPSGCRFAPRCIHAREPCRAIDPPLLPLRPGQQAACIRHSGYAL
jgi:oligopeptide/dipeptide ABC transporter ATP-binding protein